MDSSESPGNYVLTMQHNKNMFTKNPPKSYIREWMRDKHPSVQNVEFVVDMVFDFVNQHYS